MGGKAVCRSGERLASGEESGQGAVWEEGGGGRAEKKGRAAHENEGGEGEGEALNAQPTKPTTTHVPKLGASTSSLLLLLALPVLVEWADAEVLPSLPPPPPPPPPPPSPSPTICMHTSSTWGDAACIGGR